MCSEPEGTNSSSRSLFPNILSPLALRGRRREGREKGGDGVAVWTRKVVALTLPREQLTSRGETEGQREGNEKGSVCVWSIDRIAHGVSESESQRQSQKSTIQTKTAEQWSSFCT